VEVEKQELYESLFSTHDNIEEIAEIDASYDFMVNMQEIENTYKDYDLVNVKDGEENIKMYKKKEKK